ncbi:hypothetical protein [Streptomyces sp. NBC_01506]|uniref:hypothetical protein n=1 Tax=Streptomyces sp. NBC_01506 TaxID=2903887 RepID=UPI0038646C9B
MAERRVKRILWEASETDRVAARALRALAKNKHDFSGDGPGGLKEADDRQGKADADYWAKKAAETNPKDWSDADVARFNETLVNQRDNPGFSERFATTLGAEGTLQFWRDMAAPPGGPVDGDRAKILAEVQDNLSMTLATATRSDSPAMDTWKREVIAAGGKTFGHEGMMTKAYGFQIMSNLMVKGNFDSGFLRDYGNAMRTFETDTKKPFDPASIWGNPGMAAQLDYSGKDGASGSDPMAGYLKAVSHNPSFATELFNQEDMADYLLSEREFYDEDDPFGKGDGTVQSRDALGKALLAAGTGLNPDEPHVVTSNNHTDAQREVLDGALSRLAARGDDFPPELRDDMAGLLLNYGDETHHSASALADDPGDPRLLDRHDLLEVSKQVSRSQDAYGILNDGLNQEMLRDIHEDNPKDPKETLIRAGQTVGFLEEARYQALNTDKDAPTWDAKWGYHGLGGVVNFIPVVGDAAQRGVDALAYSWQLDEQGRIDEEIQRQNGETFTSRENQLKALAEEWGKANPGHTNSAYTLTDEINRAAFNGNDRANGLAGDQ